MRIALAAVLLAQFLSGCDSGPPPIPIVVYAVGDDEQGLTATLAEFTEDTGIGVTLVISKSSKNADLVINKSGSPTADILITNNVADIWRAADSGALRPVRSEKLKTADPSLTDPDGAWVAIGMRFHAIALAKPDVRPLVATFDDLAGPEYKGRLCLSSSSLHINRSLIALLIGDKGLKDTQRLVRGWVRNLTASPFPSQEELLEALRSGVCDYAIVDWSKDTKEFSYVTPNPLYVNIDAVGVARHATNPESAQRLVEWFLDNRKTFIENDAARQNIGNAGWRDEEARLLVERAGYH